MFVIKRLQSYYFFFIYASGVKKITKKTPRRMSFSVLPGTRTLDPLIKSQLLYQLS